MVYEGLSGGATPVETQGSNPWNIYGDRAAPIFIWYEKSRLRRARGKPEKYTPVISLYLRPIRTPSLPPPLPVSPSGPFYSAHRPLSRVFARPYNVRFHLALRLFSRWVAGKNGGGASFTARRSLLSSRRGSAESLNVASETC